MFPSLKFTNLYNCTEKSKVFRWEHQKLQKYTPPCCHVIKRQHSGVFCDNVCFGITNSAESHLPSFQISLFSLS